jgi:hypothetical protein
MSVIRTQPRGAQQQRSRGTRSGAVFGESQIKCKRFDRLQAVRYHESSFFPPKMGQ